MPRGAARLRAPEPAPRRAATSTGRSRRGRAPRRALDARARHAARCRAAARSSTRRRARRPSSTPTPAQGGLERGRVPRGHERRRAHAGRATLRVAEARRRRRDERVRHGHRSRRHPHRRPRAAAVVDRGLLPGGRPRRSRRRPRRGLLLCSGADIALRRRLVQIGQRRRAGRSGARGARVGALPRAAALPRRADAAATTSSSATSATSRRSSAAAATATCASRSTASGETRGRRAEETTLDGAEGALRRGARAEARRARRDRRDAAAASTPRRRSKFGFTELSTFGLFAIARTSAIVALLRALLAAGWIDLTPTEHPVPYLTEAGWKVMKGGGPIRMRDAGRAGPRRSVRGANDGRRKRRRKVSISACYEALRIHRTEVARERRVPPYVIAPDATLQQIARATAAQRWRSPRRPRHGPIPRRDLRRGLPRRGPAPPRVVAVQSPPASGIPLDVHEPATQLVEPVHLLPHAPQLSSSVAPLVPQPSDAMPLQSSCPALQTSRSSSRRRRRSRRSVPSTRHRTCRSWSDCCSDACRWRRTSWRRRRTTARTCRRADLAGAHAMPQPPQWLGRSSCRRSSRRTWSCRRRSTSEQPSPRRPAPAAHMFAHAPQLAGPSCVSTQVVAALAWCRRRTRARTAPLEQAWPGGARRAARAAVGGSLRGVDAGAAAQRRAAGAAAARTRRPTQTSPVAHAVPHAPQLAGSVWGSTQTPPHLRGAAGAGRGARARRADLTPAAQASPHAPQFAGSFVGVDAGAAAPVVPPLHVSAHGAGAADDRPRRTAAPHAPQFAGIVAGVDADAAAQRRAAGCSSRPQAPAEQTSPARARRAAAAAVRRVRCCVSTHCRRT